MTVPKKLEELIKVFARFPGIGHKTAEKFVFYLLKNQAERKNLEEKLKNLLHIKLCPLCFNIIEGQCPFCDNPKREKTIICVVAELPDLWAIEKTNEYSGVYHILGGVINQIEGIGPEKLRFKELEERIKKAKPKELIIATDPDMAGETTALYLSKLFKKYPVKITRLARGLPMGATLEYADEITLSSALKGRHIY